MERKIKNFIGWAVGEYKRSGNNKVYSNRIVKVDVEKKSYGYLIWVRYKPIKDPIMSLSMIIVKNEKSDFISNHRVLRKVISYLEQKGILSKHKHS